MCLNCETGNHASFLVPYSDLGGPLAADVSIFVVPLVRRGQARDNVNTDTFVGIRVQVADLLLLVEVADPHVPIHTLTPILGGFNRHGVGQLFQAHTLAVVPSDQVFPVKSVFASLSVVDDNARVLRKVDAQKLGQVPACVVVMVARNPNKVDFVCDLQGNISGVFQHAVSGSKYLRGPVVGGIDDCALGCGLGGEVIEVEEVIPKGNDDLVDGIVAHMLGHVIDGLSVVLGGYLEIVVIRPRLLPPTELPEVAVVQAEFNEMRSGASLAGLWLGCLGELSDQAKDALLDRLGGLASELDCDLQVGDLPQRFNALCAYGNFSLSCDFPAVDFVFSDFPNVKIDFGVREQFVYRFDLVPVVDKISDIVGKRGREVIGLLCLGGLLELSLLFGYGFLEAAE